MTQGEKATAASAITSVAWVEEGHSEHGIEWPVSGDATAIVQPQKFFD